MIERKSIYFEKAGPKNTDETLQVSKARAQLLKIRKIVVATNTGDTAVKCATMLTDTDIELIAVTLAAGRWKDHSPPDPEKLHELQQRGVRIITATQALMGNIGMAIKKRLGGLSYTELIGQTLYCFSQGVKVAVEIAVMAADAGLLAVDEEVVAIAGTNRGADTALVLTPAYSNEFFSLKIREIIAMPR
jgi:hypothetical protein